MVRQVTVPTSVSNRAPMASSRFSLTAAFVALAGVALLFDSLASIERVIGANDVSRGTLSLTSLMFLIVCVVMERKPPSVLLLTATFYAWGLVTLWFVDFYNAEVWLRMVFMAVGVTIASLAWLKPEESLVRESFR